MPSTTSGSPAALASLPDARVQQLRPRVHRPVAAMRPGALFVKTHNATVGGVPMITRDCTAGAVHLVRNPLDLVPSYADHFGLSLDTAIEAMGNARNAGPTQPHFAFQLLGDWSSQALGPLGALLPLRPGRRLARRTTGPWRG